MERADYGYRALITTKTGAEVIQLLFIDGKEIRFSISDSDYEAVLNLTSS